MDSYHDLPKIELPDKQVYSLLKDKKKAGVLNTSIDFVDLETTSGELLLNRVVEDAQYLVLYRNETLTPQEIKEVKLYKLEWALCQ